jgi:cleavage and polyadenylation specificity factor subunit 1
VLQQIVNGEPQTIAFHSEKLNEKKVLWSVYDKELYSIYTCVLNFEYLIQGRDIELVTDHKLLLSMFHLKSRIKLERRSRQIEFISQYSTKIRHVSGESNIVADVMSRIEAVELQRPISLKDIVKAQEQEPEIQNLRGKSNNKYEVRDIFFNN